jgi:hypothetical protein
VRSLRDLQRRLRDRVTSGRRGPAGGTEVYRHAYHARLAGVLRQNYPVLSARLGEEPFARLAGEYVSAHPSHHYNVRWFGAHLSRLLDGALADLARMEWALGIAFDAADAQCVEAASLAARTPEEWNAMRFTTHPSVQVLPMSWSAEALWCGAASAERRRHVLLVWRKGMQAVFRSAGVAEGAALRALRDLGSLQRVCEAMGDVEPAQVGGWLAQWLHDGMLVAR